MAITRTDKVYSGTLDTSESTVVTVTADTTFIIKGIWVSNSNEADKYAVVKVAVFPMDDSTRLYTTSP